MKIRHNVTIYNCDFCNKRYLSKSAIVNHENWCSYNPKNFSACSGCEHLENIKKEIWCGSDEDGYSRNTDSFRCNKKNIGLYPVKVSRLKLVEKYPETFEGEELMPNQCEFYEDALPF